MVSGFDLAAAAYDDTFTHTAIGRLQRERVYHYLDPFISEGKSRDILELNCGTGEDARYMANRGHKVLATDLSEEMVSATATKVGGQTDIEVKKLDIKALRNQHFGRKFDMIFSNFGGLNCISPLQCQDFLEAAARHLEQEGFLVAVIMPKKCLWERLYFMMKGQSKKAFRRSANESLEVLVDGGKVKTWYHDPSDIKRYAKKWFSEELVKPIGFAIPPSYLDTYFQNKKKVLAVLARMDRNLFRWSWLSVYADHYIIVLQKK